MVEIEFGMKVDENIIQLCKDYKAKENSANQKELAKAEDAIWNGIKRLNKKNLVQRRMWFRDKFGGSIAKYEDRASIFNMEPIISNLIWDKINNGLAITSAIRLIRNAKHETRSNKDLSLIDAFKTEIIFHESGGKRTKQGKIHAAIKSSTQAFVPNIVGRKELSNHIKKITKNFIDNNIEDADDYSVDKIVNSLNDWIDDGLKDFLVSFDKLKRGVRSERIIKIGSKNFNWACEVLGVSGTFGQKINTKVVKKRHHERIKFLHPDHNNGSEKHNAEYQSVNEAKSILIDYATQMEKK